jgi:imidazolonepropionase-like amidohydrolase
MRFAVPLAVAGLALTAGAAAAQQDRPHVFTGARLVTITGAVIDDGAMVVEGGRIQAIVPRAQVRVPANAQVVDVTGRTIMPGLVDTHSHIGGGGGADASAPIQPDVRILDAIDVLASSVKRARAGGITTVNVMPGSGHLLSGQTAYLKLRNGRIIDDLLIRDAQGNPMGGMKMANGTNSLRPGGSGGFPGTRGRSAALVREQFVRAQEYRDKVRAAGGDTSKLPPRDLALEGLVEVLEGRRTVHFHTHRHDDILTVLRLAREFAFRPVLQHVSEAWKVADEIAKAGVPSSIIVIDSPGGKLEAMELSMENGVALERAGALVGFHTDDSVTDSRVFLRSAGLAVRAGMSREKALYGMTMAGAEMMGMKDRVGSLEQGKDADFIILSGDPLSVYTQVLETWVDGVRVFDRSRAEDRLHAVGGYGAGRGEQLHLHGYEDEGVRR